MAEPQLSVRSAKARELAHRLARRQKRSIAEIAFGIAKIQPDRRAARLEQGLADWRRRFADRIFGLTEEAAIAYGDIMGAASRQGLGMSAPDGMIAAIARVNGGRLATRTLTDFRTTGLDLVSPWDL